MGRSERKDGGGVREPRKKAAKRPKRRAQRLEAVVSQAPYRSARLARKKLYSRALKEAPFGIMKYRVQGTTLNPQECQCTRGGDMASFLEKCWANLWPDTNNIEGAKKALWLGFTGAIFIAFVNLALGVLYLIYSPNSYERPVGLIIMGVFSLMMAIGIRKMYRIAAVLIFTSFSFEVLNKVQTGKGLPIAVFLLIYLFNGVRGTFAYHKLKKFP